MSSGQKREFINNREGAVSIDINRIQDFVARDWLEFWRHVLISYAEEDGSASGRELPTITETNPLKGIILGGIRPRPEIGTVNLFIEQGVAVVVDPDVVPNPDDSPAKIVVDPGIQTAGQLVLTPYGGIAADNRIDVIECAYSEVVLESDNRNQFDLSTGLFTPVTVNKVIAGRFSYRIRLGVVNGGFPGTAQGWLPLAVTRVPGTATTWNDVELWDVRPLASDLASSPFGVSQRVPHMHKQKSYAMVKDLAGVQTLVGHVEAEVEVPTAAGPTFKAGGLLSPGAAVNLSTITEPGFAAVPSKPWHIYALFPFGLPRWSRYSDAPGAREPTSPRGLLVFTQKGPADLGGHALINVPIAALGGSTSSAAPLVSGGYDSATNFLDATLIDNLVRINTVASGGLGATWGPTGVIAGVKVTYTLVPDTHHPRTATAILARLTTGTQGHPVSTLVLMHQRVRVLVSGEQLWISLQQTQVQTDAAGLIQHRAEIEIPLFPSYPSLSVVNRVIEVEYDAGSGSIAAGPVFDVIGWRLGA